MSGSGRRARARLAAVASTAWLYACASGPPPADWQLDAKAAIDDAVAAYLRGDDALEVRRFAQARGAIARTGRAELLGRAELIRCAAKVASLVFEPCTAFETLRADAPPAQAAYADFLAARLQARDVGLLPPAQRAVGAAAAAAPPGASDRAGATAVEAIDDPLSRLVAAAVLLQGHRASPAVIGLAIDAAASQGWRRPLLAWLGVQAMRAERAGDPDQAERLRRRARLIADPG